MNLSSHPGKQFGAVLSGAALAAALCAGLSALAGVPAELLERHSVLLSVVPPAPPQAADTIVIHARIYTVDRRQPWAEALAISGGKLIAVGSEKEIAPYRGPSTHVVDAGGRLVLPGFTDCHIHFLEGSESIGHVQLDGTKSVAEIQQRVKQYAAAHPGTGWVLGRGWDYSVFGAGALPDRKYLDAILPDRPALLEGYDGHTYWANSKALQLAGITRDTPDPTNGNIVRDSATGEATGALKEAASELVRKLVPPLSREEKLAALRRGMAEANRYGVVRVHSVGGDFESFDLYSGLGERGELTVRFYISYFLDPPELTAGQIAIIEDARRKYHDDWLAAGAVKTMLDGVVESHTAAMLEPYTDDSTLSGRMFWDPGKYKAAIAELDRRGLQIFTHAIGDAAVRLALDAYAGAAHTNGARDARHRIEHIETISAADIPRFGTEQVIASMQPLHAYPDADTLDVWARNVGPERASRAWPWRGIAASGGRLAYGSDWPVVTVSPWPGLQTAVTRQTAEVTPPGGWQPQSRITLEQAVDAYTLAAAYAGHREAAEGSLEAGKLADLMIVSQDIFRIDSHQINKTEVLLTMVGGKIVHEAPAMKAAGR